MTVHFWVDKYPASINHEVNFDQYSTMIDVFENAVKKFADKPGASNWEYCISLRQLDRLSAQFGA
ncbi:MAG TPA: hypothetical protein VFM46_13090 [Pseudomonadales bacterium]|nr:hypothetical protein [Pseudomonadales bacterium]